MTILSNLSIIVFRVFGIKCLKCMECPGALCARVPHALQYSSALSPQILGETECVECPNRRYSRSFLPKEIVV